MNDVINRHAIDKFIDGLEEIFADLRDRHVDDSVCGLCEYDGAYMGVSGDWCNECPGFEKNDCFKLSDKIRKEWTDEIIKALPSAQPEPIKLNIDHELTKDEYEKLRKDLVDAPIVLQPERKTGRWMITDAYPHNVYCSECHKNFAQTHWAVWEDGSLPRKFCPNCGADMRGESNG